MAERSQRRWRRRSGRARSRTEPADVVIEWNNNAQAAIIGTAGQGPTVAYLHLAMVQGAVYDAVNAIEGGYEPYLGAPARPIRATPHPPRSRPRPTTCSLRCSRASRRPWTQSSRTSLARSPTAPAKTGGIEVGAAAAAAMLAAQDQ